MSSELSATAHALLGLLSIKPMSGYDMRQMIGESIGHFWSESYGQIYPALKEMTAVGLVEKRTETQEGRPERHVYTLTDAGLEELAAWLGRPVKREVIRNELLLKTFFGVHAPSGVNRERMREFVAAQERELKMFEGIAAALRRSRAGNPNLPFWLITLSRGRHDAAACVAWAKETLAVLEGLDSSAGLNTMQHEEVGHGA